MLSSTIPDSPETAPAPSAIALPSIPVPLCRLNALLASNSGRMLGMLPSAELVSDDVEVPPALFASSSLCPKASQPALSPLVTTVDRTVSRLSFLCDQSWSASCICSNTRHCAQWHTQVLQLHLSFNRRRVDAPCPQLPYLIFQIPPLQRLPRPPNLFFQRFDPLAHIIPPFRLLS